jgi:hypothetical protein
VSRYSIPELTEMINAVRRLGAVVILHESYPRWRHQLIVKPKRGGRAKELEVWVEGSRWVIERALKAVLLGAELARRPPKRAVRSSMRVEES